MTSKDSLRSRWKTTAGRAAVSAVEDALRAGAIPEDLRDRVARLPHAEEVAPDLDLRGVALPTLVAVRRTDLSRVRFDGARLSWSFGGSTLRGARFDGAEGRNADFGGCDLRESSFVKARLPGAIFFGARLQGADLTGIHMHSGQLKGADCRGARFSGADLRMVWAAEADLRGADLRAANLTGASLGGARWDESTRLDGAALTWEGTPAELRAHALGQGARLTSEKAEWQLGLLDATRKVLEGENRQGRLSPVLERLTHLRPALERNPQLLWANILKDELDAEQWRAVQDAVRVAATNMGALIS